VEAAIGGVIETIDSIINRTLFLVVKVVSLGRNS
jgi:hypothetical protein